MKIWIDYSALKPNHNNGVFFEEALFGLRYLQHYSHSLGVELDQLSDLQRQLLNQEAITIHPFTRNEADIVIKAIENKLLSHSCSSKKFANWSSLVHNILFPERMANLERNTKETEISISVNLDGSGQSDIKTGLGFFDHMLDQIARHGLLNLKIHCRGDLEVDEHHTIEDVAIALGKTISEALGDKSGIERYGFILPMDEARAEVALDFSGRPYLKFEGELTREYVGDFPTEMLEHFFYSLAINMGITLHIKWSGKNDHHNIEAIFKGFAKCLYQALRRDEHKIGILPSSKGIL